MYSRAERNKPEKFRDSPAQLQGPGSNTEPPPISYAFSFAGGAMPSALETGSDCELWVRINPYRDHFVVFHEKQVSSLAPETDTARSTQ